MKNKTKKPTKKVKGTKTKPESMEKMVESKKKTYAQLPVKVPETLEEAIDQAKANSKSKFVGSLDIHVSTKSKEKEVSIRGTVSFPNTFGDKKRILVLCENRDKETAIKAGADFAGLDDMIAKINDGWFEFDVVLATPDAMKKAALLGKSLGPKGLMPNPKAGTVITNFGAVADFKGGKTAFKGDPSGVVHCSFGKINMETAKLAVNLKTVIDAIREACNKSKSTVDSIVIAPTMGKSVMINKELLS